MKIENKDKLLDHNKFSNHGVFILGGVLGLLIAMIVSIPISRYTSDIYDLYEPFARASGHDVEEMVDISLKENGDYGVVQTLRITRLITGWGGLILLIFGITRLRKHEKEEEAEIAEPKANEPSKEESNAFLDADVKNELSEEE